MKALKISLCFLIIFLFAACSKGEFRDLSSFVSSYNETAADKISVSDFFFSEAQSYTAFLGDVASGEVLLNLKENESGRIESCRVIIAKTPGTLPKSSEITYFREVLTHTLAAYCSYEAEAAEEIIKAFGLENSDTFSKKGELTLKKENFYYIYYSDEVTSQVRVCNTYLSKIQETSKPVSKPYYGENFIEKD